MTRQTLLLAAAMATLLCAPLPALAQDGPELNVQCVVVDGTLPADGWDEFSLQDAVTSGAATFTTVAPGEDCAAPDPGAACMTIAGGAPPDGWSSSALSEGIESGRAHIVLLGTPEECATVIAETVDPVDAPERMPLQLLETGLVLGEFSSNAVALVLNPNLETWAAQGLPVSMRVLDADGNEIEIASGLATLLPGQTSAVLGFLTTSGKPKGLDVSFEGADFNWVPSELAADVLEIRRVETKADDVMGFVTTGRVRNLGEAPVDGVGLYVVHRNKAGKIIGAEFTFVESIPAGGAVPFEVPNLSGVKRKQVADTQVYFQLSSVL